MRVCRAPPAIKEDPCTQALEKKKMKQGRRTVLLLGESLGVQPDGGAACRKSKTLGRYLSETCPNT